MSSREENGMEEESRFILDDSPQDHADFSSYDDQGDDSIIEKEEEEPTGRRGLLIAGGVGVLALAGVVTAGFLLNPFSTPEPGEGGEGNSGGAQQVNTSDGGGEDPLEAPEREADSEWWEQEDNKFPVSVDEWAQTRYQDHGGLSSHKQQIVDSRGNSQLSIQSIQMPSEEAGFTSDPEQQYKDDGTLSPYYSFWTAEDFQAHSHSYLERLMNPEYGGWAMFQFPAYPANQNLDFTNLFSDMFSDFFVSENQNKQYSEYVPIFADWNGDNYGGMNNLLPSGTRWYGKTSNEQVVPEFDTTLQQYIVHYSADVTFTAWAQDQSKLEKNGKLELTFIANDGNNSSSNKVLIDQAKLTMDGE